MYRKIIACTRKEANTTRRDERFSGVQVKSTCVSPILRLYRRKFGLRGRETVSTKEIVWSMVIQSFVLFSPCCVHLLPMPAHVVKVAIRRRNQSRHACSCRRDERILMGVLVMSRVRSETDLSSALAYYAYSTGMAGVCPLRGCVYAPSTCSLEEKGHESWLECCSQRPSRYTRSRGPRRPLGQRCVALPFC